jgi:antibiotic biosynthesis monooxygenase (ABM) superfamily enzyme
MKVTRIESGQVTVVVTWHVRQGHEQEFDAWFRDVSAAALKFPGHLGLNVVHPGDQGTEYVIVFRFDTDEHLKAWMESDVRREFLEKAEQFREEQPTYHVERGLEYWFETGDTKAPPRWKMAIVTVLGVWPVSILVSSALAPLIGSLPPILQALVVSIGIVCLLTWVVMPLLVKLFSPLLKQRSVGR